MWSPPNPPSSLTSALAHPALPVTTPSTLPPPRPAEPQPSTTVHSFDYSTIALSFSTANCGGCITEERFASLLNSLCQQTPDLPLFIALSEFRPQGPSPRFERLALQYKYHLLFDAPDPTGGVGLLLSSQIFPHPPPLTCIIPGRLIQVAVQLSPDPSFPPTSICSFYGSNQPQERATFTPHLQNLLAGNLVLMGDFNATTQPSDASTLTTNHWNQLRAWELSGQLIDAIRSLSPLPPFTRTRRYGGTKSYLDRIYFSQVAAHFLTPTSFQIPDMTNAPGFVDHDPVLLFCQPWSFKSSPQPRCTFWNHRELRLFNSRLSARFIPPPTPLTISEAEASYSELSHCVQECMQEINADRHASIPKSPDSSWHTTVGLLLRHARRRSKIFFRRIKSAYFVPPPPSILPCPRRALQRILQTPRSFDHAILNNIPSSPPKPNPAPPSLEQLRHLSRSVRRKAPGPDGIPPYLLCHLPDPIFCFIHTYITLMYAEGTVPASVSLSTTLPLYKGKGSWTDPDRWRPIAMSNSIYRLLTRWIYSVISPILVPFLSKHQYGGLNGRSCGMATTQLLECICTTTDANACLLLDLYHAFDTPPKEALLMLLQKRGLPPGILLLLHSIFLNGTTQLLGPFETAFGTTCGIKQGCPLSCLLFTTYFQLFLDFITSTLRLPFVAFVDDVALVLHSSQLTATLHSASAFLHSMGLVLNKKKSEILLTKSTAPILSPPCPIVEHVMHLGHPLTTNLDSTQARHLILEELKRTLTIFHDVPIPTFERVRLVNSVVLPAFLHRAECLWIPPSMQKDISRLVLAFCLGVAGLPPLLSPKTIHSKPPYGLGLHHFSQRYSTRVLDTLHKAHLYSPLQSSADKRLHMQPISTFRSCLTQNLPPVPPLRPQATSPPTGSSILLPHNLAALHTTHPPPPLPPGCAFSDGSFFANSARAGAAAVTPGGQVLMARTPGTPGIYPSEVLGAFLASHSSPPGTTIRLDNQGVVKVLSSSKMVVRHAYLVNMARSSIRMKSQNVKWTKGHAGLRGNELADSYARRACDLPCQAGALPQTPWDVIIEGLPHLPPHKCWTEANVPTHRHSGIHKVSFTPLKRSPNSTQWVKWIFGLCWRPGWAAYQTFWTQTPSKRACTVCHSFHNASINGTLAFCDSHPLRHAWLSAWHHHPLILDWLQCISVNDRILLGKACIPTTLYTKLSVALGRATARRFIFSFQKALLPLLTQCLDTLTPLGPSPVHPQKRKRIWVESDWDTPGEGVQPKKAHPHPRPLHPVHHPTPNPNPSPLSSILHRLSPFDPNPHPL